MTYAETVQAIKCPKCGSIYWKKHGSISCSVAPFMSECARCGQLGDPITNRRLCPFKEFVYHKFLTEPHTHKYAIIIRHLECSTCDKVETEFSMEVGESIPEKTVEFGIWPNESTWILPGSWIALIVSASDFDGNPITEPILFCSRKCMEEYQYG